MIFTLSESVKASQKIKTSLGWRKVLSVGASGVMVKEGLVRFGEVVYGWKAK